MSALLATRLFILSALVIRSMPTALAQEELAGAAVTVSPSGEVAVSVTASRPLYFTLLALCERYGWIVDYEDPVYSARESRDATDPHWRQEHPDGTGFFEPAGGKFVAALGKVDERNPDQQGLLVAMIQQYNSSANPGVFRLIRTARGRWVVSGQSRSGPGSLTGGMFDVAIKPDSRREVVSEALQKLENECSAAGVPLQMGTVPRNAISQSFVEGFGGALSCREQLGRILSAVQYSLTYDLLYDIGSHGYFLNIVPARRSVVGADGKPTSVPIGKPGAN
jgi:hypothetical protein